MKVLLVNPPLLEEFPSTSCFPPLGLASLASLLEKNNFYIEILDAAAEGLTIEQSIKRILKFSPDLLGLTAMTPNYPQALKIAEKVKQDSKIVTCLGGSHATFLPDEILSTTYFDFIIRNEGEYTFLELCQSLKNNKSTSKIPGTSFVRKGKITHISERSFIKNLDDLPFPAYHLLPFEKYQERTPPGWIRKKKWLSYCGSRGCPWRCKFCSSSAIWGSAWRTHSPKRIVDDVEYLIEQYDLRSIFFVDDNFTFLRQRALDICDGIKRKGLNFEWAANVRVDQVDLKLLRKMHEAGCWRLGFGFESGNKEILDWYGKRVTLEQARNAVKWCKQVGISVLGYFIIGAPIETEDMILETIEFAKELDPDAVGFSFLVPFPGSELYQYCVDNNLLLTKEWSKFGQDIPVTKPKISIERLRELNKKAYKEFYFRPIYIIRQFKNLFKSPGITLRGFKTILNWIR